MPVKVAKRGKMFRVVETDTGRLARNAAGTPVSKGAKTRAAAQRQASAINISQARKRGVKIPRK